MVQNKNPFFAIKRSINNCMLQRMSLVPLAVNKENYSTCPGHTEWDRNNKV